MVVPKKNKKPTGAATTKRSWKKANPERATAKTDKAKQIRALTEPQLWQALEATAKASIKFWNRFLDLRKGTNKDALSATDLDHLLRLLRAVCWVESRHGSGTGNYPKRDPMQCGNPLDAWWPQVIGSGEVFDRYVGGPNASNFYANELAAAVKPEGDWPVEAELERLTDRAKGHKDAGFTNVMSFHWAVPHLIWKINAKSGGRPAYRFENVSREELLDGAELYNAHLPDYRAAVDQALTDAGWPARPLTREGAFANAEFASIFGGAMRVLQQQIGKDSLFPQGLASVTLTVTTSDQRSYSMSVEGRANGTRARGK